MGFSCKKVLQCLLHEFVISGCRCIEVVGANRIKWNLYDDVAGIWMETVLVMLKLLPS